MNAQVVIVEKFLSLPLIPHYFMQSHLHSKCLNHSNVLKISAKPGLFFVNFVPSNNVTINLVYNINCKSKQACMVCCGGIRTRIVTLKGKHTDHLTATTAQTFPYSFRQRLLGWFLFHYCDIYVDIFRMQWAGLRQMTRDQCCRTFFMKAWRRK